MLYYLSEALKEERLHYKNWREENQLCPSNYGFFRQFYNVNNWNNKVYPTWNEIQKQIKSIFMLPLYPLIKPIFTCIGLLTLALSMIGNIASLNFENLFKDCLKFISKILISLWFTPVTLLAAIAAPISLITRSLASITDYLGDPFFEYSHLVTGDKPIEEYVRPNNF